MNNMKTRFRLTSRGHRGGMFYCVDKTTGKRASLQTTNRDEAEQIIAAKNQAERQPVLNLQIAKAYLAGTDNGITTRTWQQALESLTNTKQGANQHRWRTVARDKALAPLLARVIIETPGELLLKVMQAGTVSTNVFLRRLHNFCIDMNWLPWPLVPKRQWPEVKFKEKRGITAEEHQRIIAAEVNPERKALFHYHDMVDAGCDIRTGFDFESCQMASALKKAHVHKRHGRWVWDALEHEGEFKRLERAYFASANSNLKRLWRAIGNSKCPGKAQEYGFGRCELLPILSNAQACARYVGAYVNSQHNRREEEDKGMRSVRYALKTVPVFCDGRWQKASVRPAVARWAFVKGGAALWRLGCRVLSLLLGGVPDFAPVFGKRWAFMLAPFIFQSAEHAEELLIDAAAIPPGLTWRKRCRLVLELLNRYEFNTKDTIDLQTAEDHFLTSTPVHLPDFAL